jgi:hypothetical protein
MEEINSFENASVFTFDEQCTLDKVFAWRSRFVETLKA